MDNESVTEEVDETSSSKVNNESVAEEEASVGTGSFGPSNDVSFAEEVADEVAPQVRDFSKSPPNKGDKEHTQTANAPAANTPTAPTGHRRNNDGGSLSHAVSADDESEGSMTPGPTFLPVGTTSSAGGPWAVRPDGQATGGIPSSERNDDADLESPLQSTASGPSLATHSGNEQAQPPAPPPSSPPPNVNQAQAEFTNVEPDTPISATHVIPIVRNRPLILTSTGTNFSKKCLLVLLLTAEVIVVAAIIAIVIPRMVSRRDRGGGEIDSMATTRPSIPVLATAPPTTLDAMPTLPPVYSGTDKWIRVELARENSTDYDNNFATGHSIALSKDGTAVAVGDLAGGSVRVYRIAEDDDGDVSLLPLGAPILGANSTNSTGNHAALALSRNGTRVAVGGGGGAGWPERSGVAGSFAVYEYDGFNWQVLGTTHHAEEPPAERFGRAIAMSADGSIVAVGAFRADVAEEDDGLVRVFRLLSNGNWTQMGQDLAMGKSAPRDKYGIPLALAANGLTLAIGGIEMSTEGASAVRVYSWNEPTWEQVGQEIPGTWASLSAEGEILVIDASNFYGAGAERNSGPVHFLGLANSTEVWEDVMPPLILGNSTGEYLAWSMDVSDDGGTCIVVIPGKSPSSDETDSRYGLALVYDYDGARWIQKGQPIEGLQPEDPFGYRVAISGDGDVIMLGTPSSVVSGKSSGDVQVYRQEGHLGTTPSIKWEHCGQSLMGLNHLDLFGSGVSLTSDGTHLAVIARAQRVDPFAEVFEYTDNRWVLKGSRILPGSDLAYYDVGLPDDGSMVIMCFLAWERSPLGGVKLFSFQESDWVETTPFGGATASEGRGHGVGISNDGLVFGASFPHNSDIFAKGGVIRVYQRDSISSPWEPMGDPIYGRKALGYLGMTFALSGDGRVVAAEVLDSEHEGYGGILVFRYNGMDWEQVGQDLNWFLADVSITNPDTSFVLPALSHDGSMLAVGSTLSNDVTERDTKRTGSVNVYRLSSDKMTWTQVGDSLEGYSTAFSHDGLHLAVGEPYHDVPSREGLDHGRVRVYQWDGLNWQQLGIDIIGEGRNDWFGWRVALSGNGTIVAAAAPQGDGFDRRVGGGYVRVYQQIMQNS